MIIIKPMIIQTLNPRIRDLFELILFHRQSSDKATASFILFA